MASYPTPPQTDNHDLPLIPPSGEQNAEDYENVWGHVLNDEGWSSVEEKLIAKDTDANRANYTAYQDALFWATDTGAVYVGDGSSWTKRDASFASVIADVFEFEATSWQLSADASTFTIENTNSNEAFTFNDDGTNNISSQTYTNIKEFSTEQELIDASGGLNGNGNIELDPDNVWVVSGQVDISNTIVSQDPNDALTFKSKEFVRNGINYTGSGTLFTQTAMYVFDGVFLNSDSGGTVFDISGNSQVWFLNEGGLQVIDGDAGTISDGFVISIGGRIGSYRAGGKLTLDAISAILLYKTILFNDILETTGSLGRITILNCHMRNPIFGQYLIDHQGSVQGDILIDGVAGVVQSDVLNGIDISQSNVQVRNIYGVRDSRIAAIDKITEIISPSSSNTTESPSDDAESVRVEPDGTTTIDLGATREEDGREITFVKAGGSNTPVVSFQSSDFLSPAPSDLTNDGDSVSVEYVNGPVSGWTVQ